MVRVLEMTLNEPTIKRRSDGTHGTTAKQRKRARNRKKAAERAELRKVPVTWRHRTSRGIRD